MLILIQKKILIAQKHQRNLKLVVRKEGESQAVKRREMKLKSQKIRRLGLKKPSQWIHLQGHQFHN